MLSTDSTQSKEIAVIGGGAVGSMTALHLARAKHEVLLIDPLRTTNFNQAERLNGSTASLGVLMGNIFRRSSGRSWRLRRRSMELWRQWIRILNTPESPLKLESPLVQLASSESEASFMAQLSKERKELGVELLTKTKTLPHQRLWPKNDYGGLISYEDGRINPLHLQQCLLNALQKQDVNRLYDEVILIERGSNKTKNKWHIHLQNGESLIKEVIVICAAIKSQVLVKPLGHSLPISPVLGQVMDLELKEDQKDWSGWPAVLISEGINLIPYETNRMLLGATLEPGTKKNASYLEQMKTMNGNAPNWIKTSSITNQWFGIRGQPKGRPAPVLTTLEPGLIVATGHYRNGILLAPASAEWVADAINKEEAL